MSNQPSKDAEARSDDRAVQSFMKERHPAEMSSVEIAESLGLPPARVWGALNRLCDGATILKREGHCWKASSGGNKE